MNKLSKILVLNILLLLVVGGFAGCNSTENNTTAKNAKPADNKTTTAPETNKAPENAKPADNAKTDSTGTKSDEKASTGDSIGVPECDEYIAKFEACLDKIPGAARDTFKNSFEQQRKAWKASAANPQAKAALGSGCKQATDAAKASMAAYKCDF